jgi:cell division transport system permease protein
MASKTRQKKNRLPASQATTTFTTVVGMTLTLVLIGILAVVSLLGSRWEKQLRQEVRIQVYFQRDLDDQVLKAAISGAETDVAVAEATYLDPREEAEKLEVALGEDFIDFLGYVPLPPAMDIKVDKLAVFTERLNNIVGVSEVVWQNHLLEKIESTINKLMFPLLSLAGICMLIALALMNNTVRLTVFARRFLIRNMQLVGARPSFIRRPFLKQGLLLGVTSGTLAFALVMSGLAALNSSGLSSGIILNYELMGILAGSLIITGGGLGVISTALAVNRYLRLDVGQLH